MSKSTIIVILVCIIAFGMSALTFFVTTHKKEGSPADVKSNSELEKKAPETKTNSKEFKVYIAGIPDKEFDLYGEALEYARQFSDSELWHRETGRFIWDNYKPYQVYYTNSDYVEFDTYPQAISFAKSEKRSFIYYRKNSAMIWSNVDPLPKSYKIENVPHIQQLPELPRGCEVTSLAMLMRYKGIETTKMELAERIAKDNTPYTRANNKIFYGNPNVGFVGDMYSLSLNGLGVYHGPIHQLLESYAPYSALDISGAAFEDLFTFICKKSPVWVIITSTFNKLPDSKFETWSTSDGDIQVTYSEHSVLVTGYDEQYIYFNDPLSNNAGSKAPRSQFIEAWEQMGRQAVTIVQ